MMSQSNKSDAYFFLPSKGKSFSVGLRCNGAQVDPFVFAFAAGSSAADVYVVCGDIQKLNL